jgi:hypothetical protein
MAIRTPIDEVRVHRRIVRVRPVIIILPMPVIGRVARDRRQKRRLRPTRNSFPAFAYVRRI